MINNPGSAENCFTPIYLATEEEKKRGRSITKTLVNAAGALTLAVAVVACDSSGDSAEGVLQRGTAAATSSEGSSGNMTQGGQPTTESTLPPTTTDLSSPEAGADGAEPQPPCEVTLTDGGEDDRVYSQSDVLVATGLGIVVASNHGNNPRLFPASSDGITYDLSTQGFANQITRLVIPRGVEVSLANDDLDPDDRQRDRDAVPAGEWVSFACSAAGVLTPTTGREYLSR